MEIIIDTWLYGELAHYAAQTDQGSYANVKVVLDEHGTLGDLLHVLGLPTEQRGITFINGNLSALPGLQPDLGHQLADGDRVAFFHLRSMWPYQYRSGAAMINELSTALENRPEGSMHHSTK